MFSNDALIAHHGKVAELIGDNKFLYLDIPLHDNVGDLLIMLGTFQFFERYSMNPKKIRSAYGALGKVSPDEVILLHGGGNLGDLYHLHQQYRDDIIERYNGNRVIILPQTVYFEDDANYKICRERWSKHPDLHIFVRDRVSFSLAREFTRNVYLVPDMAHQLYPIQAESSGVENKVLNILRRDIESVALPGDVFGDVTDWSNELRSHRYLIKLLIQFDKFCGMLGLSFISGLNASIWKFYAGKLVAKIVRLYSKYGEIHTNRLHGHILAVIMEKNNKVYDNSYGKNSAYIDCWTKDRVD